MRSGSRTARPCDQPLPQGRPGASTTVGVARARSALDSRMAARTLAPCATSRSARSRSRAKLSPSVGRRSSCARSFCSTATTSARSSMASGGSHRACSRRACARSRRRVSSSADRTHSDEVGNTTRRVPAGNSRPSSTNSASGPSTGSSCGRRTAIPPTSCRPSTRCFASTAFPRTPLTVRFEFTEHPKIYWLVLGGEQPELCYYDPGRDAELVVTADEQALGRVLLGRLPLAQAVSRGDIRFDGPPALVRAFPTWLGLTRFAKFALPARGDHPSSADRLATAGAV